MTLVIDRLRQRLRSERPIEPGRLQAWNQALASLDGHALTAGLTTGDEWLLIRRLPLALRWRDDAAEGDVTLAWQQAVRRGLERVLGDRGNADVVRYADQREALADLLYRSALGDAGRSWAWHRMALVDRPDTAPTAALAHGLARLLREPEIGRASCRERVCT